MRLIKICIVCGLGLWAAQAGALEKSLRPMPRPEIAAPVVNTEPVAATEKPTVRPMPRPKDLVTKLPKGSNPSSNTGTKLAKAQICNDPRLQGKPVGSVPSKTRGCGVENAVQVTAVMGVKLSQAATMDCATATALAKWTEKAAIPLIGDQGGGLARLDIMGHYTCRPRNNVKGSKISEHGRGRAVDIGGFTLKNGASFSVLKDWRGSKWSDELKKMHKLACGPFGTVLGPNANAYHKNHFHFDTARYRNGAYCQ